MNEKKFLKLICTGAAICTILIVLLARVLHSRNSAKIERDRRIAEGWSDFEGKFISPEEKNSLIKKRETRAAERVRAIQAEKQRVADEQAAVIAEEQRRIAEEQARLETERREREQRAKEEQSNQIYGKYRQRATALADNLLKVISATQTGISLMQYNEMMQELQFSYNKFSRGLSKEQQNFTIDL